jgi:hypothetical protein
MKRCAELDPRVNAGWETGRRSTADGETRVARRKHRTCATRLNAARSGIRKDLDPQDWNSHETKLRRRSRYPPRDGSVGRRTLEAKVIQGLESERRAHNSERVAVGKAHRGSSRPDEARRHECSPHPRQCLRE